MILKINKFDCAALTLHMSIMRKSFKVLTKKQYNSSKSDLMSSYDYVLQICRDGLEQELEYIDLHLNVQDINVLHEFLLSYTTKLKPLLDDKKTFTDLDNEQINSLCKLCSNLHILKLSA